MMRQPVVVIRCGICGVKKTVPAMMPDSINAICPDCHARLRLEERLARAPEGKCC